MGMPETVRQVLAERYTVERELGRGGMGVVYLARDLRHQRAVALKVLLPEFASGSGTERFQREILFAARLQHPHILTVLDSGKVVDEANGVTHLWFTMPFVEGESLRERLDREGRLVLEDALRITTETARALDYAHGQGVIHRDIKPENILLTRDGTTLVTDFGIARAAGAKDRLTQTGAPIGTAAYMSPEATDEVDADARSDQYSLAVVLYEMLAGEPAFTGRSLHAIVAKRLSDPTPSVRSRAPSTPLQVDAAIERAMAPQPAEALESSRRRWLVGRWPDARMAGKHRAVGVSCSSPRRRPAGSSLQQRGGPCAGLRRRRLTIRPSSRCSRSRTRATRPTRTSPTASPTRSAPSSRRSQGSR